MIQNVSRWLGYLLLVVGVGLSALAGYFLIVTPPLEPSLYVETEEIEVHQVAPKVTREVTIRLENRSRMPIRILGAGDC